MSADTLARRLREFGWQGEFKLPTEAADRIEALEAEAIELRRLRDAWQNEAKEDLSLISTLRAEVERLALDAGRYQWLRCQVYVDPKQSILRIANTFLMAEAPIPQALDAAIDAARGAAQKGNT